ncbi:MAG: glycosyltransferase family 2 protein [Oligoflexales bacterium]|nr:glycosyltransferase family 2 protein [Oligoflexales bacterium]
MDSRNLDLSAILITLNEEKRITQAIESLPIGSEVIVLDSGSTDKTVELAKKAGAQVSTRGFDNYASQKNAALDLATRKWVLSIDADEVLSRELCNEIAGLIQSSQIPNAKAFRLKRRLIFMNRTMKYGKTSDQPIRLFMNGEASFKNAIHEELNISGKSASLKGCLYHYSYENITDYFDRFNKYTSKIALKHYKNGKKVGVSHTLRPWIEFTNRYFIRLGFLDGYPGYCYALLSSLYAFVKYSKLKELYKSRK